MPNYVDDIAAINQATSLSQIQQIVGKYSAQAIGSGGVVYSGYVGSLGAGDIASKIVQDTGGSLNIINNTAKGMFLSNPDVVNAIQSSAAKIFSQQGLADYQLADAAKNFLYGGVTIPSGSVGSLSSSLWGQASSEFASSLSGDITVVGTAAQANPFRIFAQIELPALLNNPKVTP